MADALAAALLRIDALEKQVREMKALARGPRGEDGRDGERGPPGRDGKSVREPAPNPLVNRWIFRTDEYGNITAESFR